LSSPSRTWSNLTERLTYAGAELTAARLLNADADGISALNLTVSDQETILRILDHPPEGLAELRAASRESMSGRNARGSKTKRI
jgi:hypothetical protein